MYRYRDNDGVTSRSIKRLDKLAKLGTITHIKGYSYKGRHGVYHCGVLVKGSNGSARYSGFGWGYSGEGPRGLKVLLQRLNVDDNEINRVLSCSWDFYNDKKVHWEINL